MSTYIGFNLNSNRQIEHFQTIENRYGINSDGGKFLFGQAELALKGSYIPKEEVYLIPYQGAVQPGNIERFIKDMTHNGGLSCATHFPLRDIAFVYENTSPYGIHNVDSIQRMLQKAKDNPLLKKQLNAYRAFSCFFSRGIQCAQKYLQHIGDNFFSPVYRDADKLQIYYFSTSNINLIKEASKCSNMFEHGLKKIYLPQKAHFLDSNMIANYTPAVECSMAPSLECYNQLAEKLNLGKSQKNYNIGVLDRICKTGQIGNLEKDSRFNHQNSFVSLDERIRLSYVGKQDGTLLKNALERTIKDTAKRILQTDYAVRGYEPPKQEKKKSRSITM